MVSIDKYGLNNTQFNFSFTTSSGDKIDLKMFDSIKTTTSFKKGNGYISKELTLKHQYGYEFHYEGNGLDANDLKEIKEALKKIKPLFEKFLKEKQKNEQLITNISHSIKSLLPKPKNQNHLNAIKNSTVDTFDKVLKSIQATMLELEKTKKLFDKVFSPNKLEIYA